MPSKMLAEVRPFQGGRLLLPKRERPCDSGRGYPLLPMHHTLSPTIQCQSLTTRQPPHSAGHRDKDRCDEKQSRWRACAPFLGETLAIRLPQNHSNILAKMPTLRLARHCSAAAESGSRPKSFSRFAPGFDPPRLSAFSLPATLTGGAGIGC